MRFKRVVSMLPMFERSRAAILLSCLVFLAAPAWGAVAFVQKVPTTTTATHFSGTSAQTITITPTAGNLLVVVVTVAGATNPTNTVTVSDSDSVSYTAAGNATTSGGLGRVSIFYRPNVTAGAKTITITPSAAPASPAWAVEVMEYSGVNTTPTVTTASATGSSTTPTVSVTPTAGASLYIAATGTGNATPTSYTSGAGWTQRYSDPSNSPNPPNASEEITSATGAQTATWTQGASTSWVAVIAAFSTPSSGGIAWIQNVNNSVGNPCGANYSYVRTVTIDHTKVPNTDQSNFPVLFSGTYSYLATVANGGKVTNTSGFDIIFTNSAGAKLDHEIESYSATTGAVNFWVRVPTVSFTTDTVISLCYGNAAISTSQENKTGVWDANFKGVWHMKENPAGAAPQMKDSTATANNGTSNGGMTSANQVAGQINGSINFDGTNDYIQAPDYDITGAITISAWIKWNVVGTYDGIVSKRTPSEVLGDWAFRMDETTPGLLEWEVWTAVDTRQNVTSVSAISTGAWNHVVLTFDDPTNTTKFYINGVLDKTDTSMTNSLANTPEPIRIGYEGQSAYFNGIIDEARISNSVRSADWVTTEYNNQSSPSTFYTLGAESAGNGVTSITSPALTQEILAGDLIVVGVRAPPGTLTVTDNQGQTYTLATGPTNNHSIYYFPNSMAVPANTLTVTATTTGTAGTMRIFVDVFRGAATSNVLDTTSTVTAKNAATSCTVIPDSSPSAGNGELVYLTAGMTTQSTYTACTTNGAAMTIGGQNNTSPNGSMFTSYALASLAGAQNAAIQAGTACVGCLNGGVAIFRPVCTYNFRKSITVNSGQVIGGPHTNFPLLVNFTDANLKTTANGGNVTDASGDDIIFRDSAGTQLDHEIETYTATTGELVAWVRVPSINTGTVIYMYYGNSCVTTPTQNPNNVWDANFKGVWHLKEAAAANRLDSTVNANTLAPSASNPTQVAGKINGASNFASASSQYLTSGGALAVDAAASTSAASTSSFSWSHTASGTNRLVIVGVSWKKVSTVPPPAITSVTYGGTAMTLIGSKSHSDQEIAMYQLVAPPTGAQTVSVTFAATVTWAIGGSTSFTGAHQTTPTGTFATAEAITGNPSVNVTSAAGEIVIDTLNYDSNATTLTVGAGQAQQWKIKQTGWGAGSTEAGAASVTMSWTASPSNDNWVTGAVSVKPAAAGTGLNLGTQFTLEAWVKGNEVTTNKTILGKDGVASNASYKLRFSSDRFTEMTSFDGTAVTNLNQSGTSVAATWYHVVGVYNSPTMYLYINGVLNNSVATAGGAVFSGTSPFNIGSQNNGTQPFEGIIDEARVSDVARSAGWIQTEFNNESAPGSFSAVGAQEGPGALNAYETGTYKGAITGFINTKIAGATASLDIIALTTTTPKTIDTSTTWSARQVKVEVLNTSDNSGALDANNCRSTWASLSSVNVTFPACTAGNCGRATFNLTMPANSYPNARLRISWPTSSPTSTGCSTDNFAIRPGTFSLAVTDTDWQTTGTPGARALNLITFAATTPIHKAGRPFSVRATAQASAGAATTNYAGAPTPTLKSCEGVACSASFGTLTLGTSFASGALAADAATYNNVGSFGMQLIDQSFSSVDAIPGDTPANCSGQYVCGVTLNVGRFVPDHFAVSYNTPVFGTTCGTFTYIGQPYNYTTAPVITVTAQDFANNTTTLYNTTGSWWRITNASLTGKAYSAATGTIDVSGLPGTDPVIVSSGLGVGTLTFSSGTGLLFTRTTPAAPFNADVSLAINVIDADGVTYASNPARFSAATAGNGIAFSGGKPMRFGRLALGNALGSELLNLPVPIQTQYWDGTNFVTNTGDSCTTITASNIVLSNYQGALTSGNLPSGNISISGAFNAGVGSLKLTKPSSAVNGTVDLCVDLGGDATCLGTSANMTYLGGAWAGTTYTYDPRSRAAFGFSKGSYSGGGRDPFVYQRENY